MSQFFTFAAAGIPYGCIFALMAAGLVIAFRTSGVFNLAFGAQAYVAALVFYVVTAHGWPVWVGFVVAVVLVSPALGVLFERLIFRHVRTQPMLVKLVPVLGIMIGLPELAHLVFGDQTRLAPPSLFLGPNTVYLHVAGVPLNGTELSTTLVTLGLFAALFVLLEATRTGLRLRAVVESPRMAQLTGVDAERAALGSWMLSSFVAGLAGVLLAPLYVELSSANFTGLLVAAIAAGALGGFTSLPLALAGGLCLGVMEEVLGGYLPSGSVLSSGLQPSFPFLVLVVLLVTVPRLRRQHEIDDPLAACDPPPPPPPVTALPAGLQGAGRDAAALAGVALLAVGMLVAPANWVFTLTLGLSVAIIFLSITVLTGLAGQVSLCQATFAGIGAFTAGQLVAHAGLPVLVGALVGAALAALLGALLALPTLRMGTLAFALATLAFALLADNIGFPPSWSGNGATGVVLPRPSIGALDLAHGRAFFLFIAVLFVLVASIVHLVQRGFLGQRLRALSSSEVAAGALGIDVARTKVVAFALAAGIAGLGGALYGSVQGAVAPNDFIYELSLVFFVVVVTTGVRTIRGALYAGLAYAVIQQLLTLAPARYSALLPLLFALGTLGYARHPEGAVESQERRWLGRLGRLLERFRTAEPPPGEVATVGRR
ncbi:MAG: ABC transporter permease subunit [Acidimicrobiales bacterium]